MSKVNLVPMSSSPNNDYTRSYGTNWTRENTETLFEWMTIAAYNIRCLDLSAARYRSILRNHTIMGLILSTLSGTLGVSQFGLTGVQYAPEILNGFFILFTFGIAIYTGAIKVYQIQESLEDFIRYKQEWTTFSTRIASELQLPLELRRDALYIIVKHKQTYLELLKADLEIPVTVVRLASAEFSPHKTRNFHFGASALPNILIDICDKEQKEFDKGSYDSLKLPLLPPSSKDMDQMTPDKITLSIN